MTDLFTLVWNKVLFRRQENYERDIEAASKGLELLGKIKETMKKEAITAEEAEILKARVFKRTEDLIGLGAMPPLRGTTIDQRQLLVERRDMKLLASGQEEQKEDKK